MKRETSGSITETAAKLAMEGASMWKIAETQRVMLQEKTESLADWCNEWAEIDKFYMVYALETAYVGLREMLTEQERDLLDGLKVMLGAAVIAVQGEEEG